MTLMAFFIANTVVFVMVSVSGDNANHMAIICPDHTVLRNGEEDGVIDVEHLESEQ